MTMSFVLRSKLFFLYINMDSFLTGIVVQMAIRPFFQEFLNSPFFFYLQGVEAGGHLQNIHRLDRKVIPEHERNVVLVSA